MSKEPPKTIAHGLFLRLREDILKCRLRPGDRLRLDALRDSYGVGMSPLREALSRLSSMGLVTLEGQRGFSVARISIEDLLGLTKSRVWIETLALRFAIATGDRNWEAEILASAHRLSGCPIYLGSGAERVSNEAWQTQHRAFHTALVSVGTSEHILRFREHLFDLSDRYRRLSGLSTTERDIAGEHKALGEATLARDIGLATEIMTSHLVETTRWILESDPEYCGHADQLISRLLDDIRAGVGGGSGQLNACPTAGVPARMQAAAKSFLPVREHAVHQGAYQP
jgi:GntR family transcriptional regulator, carbon starvation induced regulator